jgi:hypothetical protein
MVLGLSITPSARRSPKSRSKVRTMLPSVLIRGSLEAKRSDVSGFVTKLFQELDSLRRNSGIRQESHPSLRAERVHFVVSERRSIGEPTERPTLFDGDGCPWDRRAHDRLAHVDLLPRGSATDLSSPRRASERPPRYRNGTRTRARLGCGSYRVAPRGYARADVRTEVNTN